MWSLMSLLCLPAVGIIYLHSSAELLSLVRALLVMVLNEWCGLVGGQDKSAGVGSSYSYNRDDLGYLSDGEVWFFRDNTQVTPHPRHRCLNHQSHTPSAETREVSQPSVFLNDSCSCQNWLAEFLRHNISCRGLASWRLSVWV